ncbi:hypothetical protein JCM10213_000611, partial [Rhodosporidiobolus nylandii]
MTPSRSWTRIQPQQPFVNGRGNVQLPGAPRQFIPTAPSPSLSPGGSGFHSPSGSPTIAATARDGSPSLIAVPVQQRGEQAYVARRDPSPAAMAASASRSSIYSASASADSPPLSLAASTDAAPGGASVGYLPSQFGVRQRVAIKTSSRPAAPRSGSMGRTASAQSGGSGGGSGGSPQIEQGRATPLSVQEDGGKGKGPLYPSSPFAASTSSFYTASPPPSTHGHSRLPSRSSSLQPSSSTDSAALSPSSSGLIPPASSASPAPSTHSHRSVLDRPRPRTPDPFAAVGGGSSFASRGGAPAVTKVHAPRPSAPAALPAFVSPSSSGGSSVLNRRRPRTPDPVSALSVSSSEPSPALSRPLPPSTASAAPESKPVSVLDRPRPKTPDAAAAFRFGIGGGASGREREQSGDGGVFAFAVPPLTYQTEEKAEDPPPLKRSVLDRPRPRTPDPQRWLDSAAVGGSAGSNATVRAAQVALPLSEAGSASSRQTSPIVERQRERGAATSTSFSSLASSSASAARPSFDSATPSNGAYSRTFAPSSISSSAGTGSPARGMFSSSSSSTTPTTARDSAPPPALDLDFPSLNFEFDLGGSPFSSSETMFGLSDMLKPLSSGLAPSSWEDEEDGATTPTPTTERRDLSTAAPHPAPDSVSSTFSLPASAYSAPSSAPLVPQRSAGSSSGSVASGGYLVGGALQTPSNGRHASRKAPPEVDLKLQLELELERAIPVNRSILDGDVRGSQEEDRAKRMRRELGDEDDERGRNGPLVREMGSMSSLASSSAAGSWGGRSRAGTGTGSLSDASVLSASQPVQGHGQPQPQKRKRRRSLASLLSIGGSSLLGKDEKKEKGRERERPGTPEPGMRSFTPEPGMSTAAHAVVRPAVQPPSTSTFAPRLSLDKSLPPTPLIPSPAEGEPDSPAKRASGGLGRQLSRLRNRSNPTSAPGSASPSSSAHGHGSGHGRAPGFQVISATTTRKRANGGSISSLATSETHGSHSRRESYEFGALPRSNSGPFTGLVPSQAPAPSSAAPSAHPAPQPGQSGNFGPRVVDRFKSSTGSSKPTHTPSDSWTAPVKDHSADLPSSSAAPNGPPRQGRRRASLSSLLSFDSGEGKGAGSSSVSADGHGMLSSSASSKKLLGMSLPAGRKSEDLLTSGCGWGRGSEREMRRDWEEGGQQRPQVQQGRRSFDALTDATRATVVRRPSTDSLLSLASAKLSKLAVDDEEPPLTASTIAPPLSATTSHFESAAGSSAASGRSTPSDEVAGKAAAAVAHAALINRSDPPTSAPLPAPAGLDNSDVALYGTRTAAPVLVRSDSLRSGPPRSKPAPLTSTAPPAVPSSAVAEDGAASQVVPRTPQTAQSRMDAMSRKQRAKVPDSGVGSDASISHAWVELEDALNVYAAAVREKRTDRSHIVNNTLLPFLRREEDDPAPMVNETLVQRQRDILFAWMSTLTTELREMQPSRRGACLEAVAAIAESHFFSAQALQDDLDGQAQYRSAVVQIVDFVVEKLNDKAVYANTLVSGRVFALAFFRIPGVAVKLLRALPPVKRHGLERILQEAGVKKNDLPPADLDAFPSHLWPLCLRDFRAYTTLLLPPKTAPTTEDDHFLVRDGDVEVGMTGNWLIQWTASDSDLSFAFHRACHAQLVAHPIPFEARATLAGQPALPPPRSSPPPSSASSPPRSSTRPTHSYIAPSALS